MRRSSFLLLLLPGLLAADVRLPAVLSDRMVLQSDRPIHVWGWAEPGEPVETRFRGKSAAGAAGADGRWSLYLPPEPAGGPDTLEVRGRNRIEIRDVLVGEVWLGSGQSNMVWLLRNTTGAEDEIASANRPGMRFFKVKLDASATPKDDVEGEWIVCSPDKIGEYSAAGYYFSRHLHEKTGAPVGFIQSAWGGTPAQAWTSFETLDSDPQLHSLLVEWRQVLDEYPRAKVRHEQQMARWREEAAAAKKAGTEAPRAPAEPRGPLHQHAPATLYNAMIAPLTPYAIRGVIWYQGENDANQRRGYLYRRLFREMIEDWRRAWGVGAFPFLFVQLANYARVPETSEWPELREAQALTLGLANTGMAVAVDIGESGDIHPKNKRDVGDRLALAARAVAYGERALVYSGPMYRQHTVEGDKLRLWFDHAGSGLELRGGGKGFRLAGPDGRFHEARAEVVGATIVLTSPAVRQPVAARYAWAADPETSLFNREGLPASPFRTDQWRD